jgi:uncharacterized protein (DUF736 family)
MKPLENRPGSGVLFHRQADGNRPTLTGGFNWEGQEFEISGWEKVSKAGKEYISLSIKKARTAEEQGRWQP